MNNKFRLLSAAALVLACGAANAIAISTVTTNPGLFTTQPSVCTVNFNGAPAASLTACSNATYSANAINHIVSGNLGGQYAQPLNDATPYMTVGGALGDPVTITLAVGANYFGFYAGSIDSYNSIVFTALGGSSVTLTGTQIAAFLGGPANASEAGYFNVMTDSLFTMVSLQSSQAAFETDNHAFGIAARTGVPEPESVALLGLGAVALVATRKRRRAK